MGTLFYLIFAALCAIPLFKLLPRFGLNALWSLAVFVPFVGLVALLWVVAARADRLEEG